MNKGRGTAARIFIAAALIVFISGLAEAGMMRDAQMSDHSERMKKKWMRQTSGATQDLTDHGGPIIDGPVVYTIYWGDQSQFPADLQQALGDLFQGLGGSGYVNILTQYLPTVIDPSFGASAIDTSAAPSQDRGPSVSTIVDEACKVIGAGALPLDPNAIYFIATSTFPSKASFCAWHSTGKCAGVTIPVVYLPNLADTSGCRASTSQNPYSVPSQSMANAAAHEMAESITDPQSSAWYDSYGNEVADKCAWRFASPVILNGVPWELQELWSNSAGGCAQSQ
jgi:hypothetical protein